MTYSIFLCIYASGSIVEIPDVEAETGADPAWALQGSCPKESVKFKKCLRIKFPRIM